MPITLNDNISRSAANPISRRTLLAAAGGIASAATLSACGFGGTTTGGSGGSGRKDIRYWYWADSPAIGEFFTRRITEFNDSQSKIRVIPEVQPNSAAAQQKIITTAAAGSGLPDVSYSSTAFQQQFYTSGISEPVEEYFKSWADRDDIIPELVETQRMKPGQPLLWLPWGVAVEMQYYRTDLYKTKGLEAPDTIEQVFDNARALTDGKGQYGLGIRGGDQWGFSWNFLTYLMNMGVNIVDANGNTTLDSPEAIDAAQSIMSLFWDGIAQKSALEDKLPQMKAQMQGGTIAQWQASTNHSVVLLGDGGQYKDVISAVKTPKGAGFPRRATMAAAGNTLMKSSKNKDEAWEFMTYLLKPEIQAEFSKIVAFSPVRRSVAEQDAFKSDPFHKLSVESAPDYASYPYWHKNWVKMQTQNGVQDFQRTLQKQLSVPDFMKSLATLMRDM